MRRLAGRPSPTKLRVRRLPSAKLTSSFAPAGLAAGLRRKESRYFRKIDDSLQATRISRGFPVPDFAGRTEDPARYGGGDHIIASTRIVSPQIVRTDSRLEEIPVGGRSCRRS